MLQNVGKIKMRVLNTLSKISIVFFILIFSLLSINTFITGFLGGSVYASSNMSVTCGDLATAIFGSGSSVVTAVGYTNSTIPLKYYKQDGNSWNGGSRIAVVNMTTNGNTSSPTLVKYSCSAGSTINIPSGTAYLEYITYYTSGTSNYYSYVDAIPKSIPSKSIPPKPIPTVGSITNPANISGSNIISTLFNDILPIVYGLLGVIVIALISYAGFLWMTSNGDTQKIARAKSVLTGVVIGVSIIALAYAISLLAVSIL